MNSKNRSNLCALIIDELNFDGDSHEEIEKNLTEWNALNSIIEDYESDIELCSNTEHFQDHIDLMKAKVQYLKSLKEELQD